MTAARRPRSAALLVGSTSATSANVQSAGQSFKRFLASARTCLCRLPVEPHSSSGHIWSLIASTRRRRASRSPSCWNCFHAGLACGCVVAGDEFPHVALVVLAIDEEHGPGRDP